MEDLNENVLDENPLGLGEDVLSQPREVQTKEKLNPFAEALTDGESHSFGEHAQDAALGVVRGAFGFGQSLYELADFVTGDQFLPDVNMRKWAGESKTMTGSLAEGITQFLTGFVPIAGGLGKAAQLGKAAGSLSKFGKFAKITKASNQSGKVGLNWKGDMIAGTVTDFVAFGAHEDRLSNILVEYPALSNPVTEFLKADPDDHELMGRLKNSIEGALTDVAITVAMKGGFLKALDVIKQGKKEVPEGVDPLSIIDSSKIDTDSEEIGRIGQESFQSKVFEGDGSTRAEVEGGVDPDINPLGEERINGEFTRDQLYAQITGRDISTQKELDTDKEWSDIWEEKRRDVGDETGTRGVDSIMRSIAKEADNPNTKMTQKDVQRAKDFFDTFGSDAFKDVKFDYLDQDSPWSQRVGSFNMIDSLVKLYRGGEAGDSVGETFFHESAHVMSRSLGNKESELLKDYYSKKVSELVKEKPYLKEFTKKGDNGLEWDYDKKRQSVDENEAWLKKYKLDTLEGSEEVNKFLDDGKINFSGGEYYRYKNVDEMWAESVADIISNRGDFKGVGIGFIDDMLKKFRDMYLGITDVMKAKKGGNPTAEILEQFRKRKLGEINTPDSIRGNLEPELLSKAKPTKAELKQQSTNKVAKGMADEHFPKEGFKDVKMQQKALKPSLMPNAGAINSYMKRVYENLNLSAVRKVSISLDDIKESAKTTFEGLIDDMEKLGLPADQVFKNQVEGKNNDITLDEMLSYTLANRSIQNVFNEQALMIASEFRKVDKADTSTRMEMIATMKSLVSQSVMVDAANSELIASKAGLLLKAQDKNWSGSLKKVGLDADEVKDAVKAHEFIHKMGDSDDKVWENLIDMMDEFSDRIELEPALIGKMFTKDLLGDGYKFLNRMRMYAMLSGAKTQLSNAFFAMSHHFARRMWQNTGMIFSDPEAAWKLMSNYSDAMFTTDKITKMAYHKNFAETISKGTSAFEGASGMKFNDSGFGEGYSWLERTFLSLPTKMMQATDSVMKSKLFISNLHRKVILDAHKAKITDPEQIKKNFMDAYNATVLDSGRLNNRYNYQKDAIAKKKASGDWDKMSATERTIFKNQANSTSKRKLGDYDKMQQEALYQSDKTLHMQVPDKGSVEGRVLNAINAFPASELVIPFKKTPINVITSGLSFAFAPAKALGAGIEAITPDGALGKMGDYLVKELSSKDPLVKAEARGKAAISAGIWTTMLMTIEGENERITGGGPSDYNELRRLEETGWQKYSIKVGSKYYSYQKTDPVATLLGLAADLRDGVRNPSVDSNNLAMAYTAVFMTAVKRNVLEKSFLVGVDQFFNAMNDEDSMLKYITNFGTSFLPAALPQAGEIITGDAVQTEAWTFMDSVKRRGSGVFDSGSLDPKRNVLGEEVSATSLDSSIDQGWDIVANVSRDLEDPLLDEIANLRHGFTIPSHTIAGGIDLRDFEQSSGKTAYDYYRKMQSEVKINGRRMRPALERLINSNRYKNINPYSHRDFKTQRIAEIQKIMRRYKAEALDETFTEFPEIEDIYKQSVNLRRRSKSGSDIQSQVEELINTY